MRLRRLGWALAAGGSIGLIGAVVLGLIIGPRAGAENEFGCLPERMAFDSAFLFSSGGYETPEEALEAKMRTLAKDRVAEVDRLLQALSQRDGPDRFDPETGKLYLDGELLIQVGLAQLREDASWAVGSAKYCSAPPPASISTGPTPSLAPDDEAKG